MNKTQMLLNLFSQKIKAWGPSPFTLLSAALIVLSFPPFGYYPLLWIALIPWFIALNRTHSYRSAAKEGFWLGYGMSLGGFHWVAFVLTEFGGVSYSIGVLGLLLFAMICEPQFIFAALVFRKLKTLPTFNRSAALPILFFTLIFAVFYTALDWILPKLFIDSLGHAFYSAQNLRQIADLGGVSLITFLAVWFNLSLWKTLNQPENQRKKAVPSLFLSCTFLALSLGYGAYRHREISNLQAHPVSGIQSAAIQANIGDFEKVAAEKGVQGAGASVLEEFTRLTRQAMQMEPKPEVIIWPETAYPTAFRKPRSSLEYYLESRIENLIQEIRTPLLFGGYDTDRHNDYNSFFFLSPEGNLETYHKNILLLFGEYIPGADFIPLIKQMFPQVGNFGRGAGPEVLEIPTAHSKPDGRKIRVQPAICYEILFPNFILEATQRGSEAIFNITNDSWFGSWGEPQLHLALSTFRAIETRLPILRSTNTGISALILPTGEIKEQTEIGKQAILNVFVPITTPVFTLIKAWGDWFGVLCVVISCISLLFQFNIKKRAN
jgi:apolipoprotein N-acyltransferase